MKNIVFLLLISSLLITASCVDEISFDTPEKEQDTIIIEGRLIVNVMDKTMPATVEINISKVFLFTGFNTPLYVSDATVQLADATGASLTLTPYLRGNYRGIIAPFSPDFSIEEGQSYQVLATFADGREYESTLEPLLPVPEIESLGFSLGERQFTNPITNDTDTEQVLKFNVSTPLTVDGEKVNLAWEFSEVYKISDSLDSTCYAPQRLNMVNNVLFDSHAHSGDQISQYPILENKINYHYAEGNYLTVWQQSLSPDAHKYLSQAQQLVDQTGTMFEASAGRIGSNMKNKNDASEEVLGFFYATKRTLKRIYIKPEDANFPSELCPPMNGGYPPEACDSCWILPNSSVFPPFYWEE